MPSSLHGYAQYHHHHLRPPVLVPTTRKQKTPSDLIRRKSLESLDYSEVRAAVAEHTMFPLAKELAEDIKPVYTAGEVEKLQRETRDGMAHLEESGDPDLSATGDATEAVARARLGGVLTGKELLEVADSLEVLGRARSAFSRNTASAPILAEIASGIPELLEVQRQVRWKIGIRGEVLDGATPILGTLRRHTRAAYQHTVQALERIMRSPVGEEALQDRVISVRADRLVLQVRTELRHKIPGIVHDVSKTDSTLFVEPFATVDACNAWRELALEEDQETRKVLTELSELVGAVADDIRTGMRLTARLDLIMARARYSARLGGIAVQVGDDESGPLVIRLVNARHPLLGRTAVPVSADIGADASVLVITGPNTGGKTVSMKTIGLLALMHQSGLCIPAEEGSILPVFDAVYADVGDQQSIAGSVSTFSSHMLNVIEILDHATTKSLVLLDELGTSTDPEEGSALAKAILQHLAKSGIKTVVTTHHRTVAAFAEASPGMMNASVDLDPSSLRPTYHLTMGVPGRSYAMSVARQLGLTEGIMAEAARLLEPQSMQFEDWLNELQSQRMQLKTMRQEAEDAKRAAETKAEALEAELDDLRSRREDIVASTRVDLSAQFEQARRKLRRAEAALSWDAPSGEPVDYEAIKRARVELEEAQTEAVKLERTADDEPPEPTRPIRTGDLVQVRGLNVEGAVQSVDSANEEATVIVGDARFTLDVSRLIPVEGGISTEQPGPFRSINYDLEPTETPTQLDIRGMRADEASFTIEKLLDRALRDDVGSLRIVHGKGRGILRQSVQETLDRSSLVRSYRYADHRDGGIGVTVVELM